MGMLSRFRFDSKINHVIQCDDAIRFDTTLDDTCRFLPTGGDGSGSSRHVAVVAYLHLILNTLDHPHAPTRILLQDFLQRRYTVNVFSCPPSPCLTTCCVCVQPQLMLSHSSRVFLRRQVDWCGQLQFYLMRQLRGGLVL